MAKVTSVPKKQDQSDPKLEQLFRQFMQNGHIRGVYNWRRAPYTMSGSVIHAELAFPAFQSEEEEEEFPSFIKEYIPRFGLTLAAAPIRQKYSLRVELIRRPEPDEAADK